MLGSLLNSLAGQGQVSITQVPFRERESLVAGTPVVSMQDMSSLRDTGLPTRVHFGIVSNDGCVICQCCQCEALHNVEFAIKEISIEKFCPAGTFLYTLNGIVEKSADFSHLHRRAKRELGSVYRNLRSYPGDDFVKECVTAEDSIDACRKDARIGQHWWTPLYYNVEELQSEIVRSMRDSTGISIPMPPVPKKFNVECLHFRHHGIVIEDGWVIHFARCRVPDLSNQVKFDTLETFCNITPYAEPGGPCDYKGDTEYRRLVHRNRAVWQLFHADEWGKYNLFTNNCEHFSRFCKVGRRQSAQVKNGVAQAALTAASLFIPGGAITRFVAALGLNVVYKKTIPQLLTKLPLK